MGMLHRSIRIRWIMVDWFRFFVLRVCFTGRWSFRCIISGLMEWCCLIIVPPWLCGCRWSGCNWNRQHSAYTILISVNFRTEIRCEIQIDLRLMMCCDTSQLNLCSTGNVHSNLFYHKLLRTWRWCCFRCWCRRRRWWCPRDACGCRMTSLWIVCRQCVRWLNGCRIRWFILN